MAPKLASCMPMTDALSGSAQPSAALSTADLRPPLQYECHPTALHAMLQSHLRSALRPVAPPDAVLQASAKLIGLIERVWREVTNSHDLWQSHVLLTKSFVN